MMRPRTVLFAIWACLLGATLPTSGQAQQHPFSTTVETNFSTWAGDANGRLTAVRVTQLLRDPRVSGAQAAALAVIHLYQRYHHDANGVKDYPALTLAFFKEHKFENAFERALKRIAAPRQLFVHQLPSLDGLKQGPLGDCYFMSPLAAAVHRDPEAVRDMLRPRQDGSCEVVFPDGERFHVPRLTDGQIAISSVSGDNGLWSNVLEEAYGLHRLKAAGHRGDPSELALDAIAKGGGAAYPIEVFTGHEARHIVLYHSERMSVERAEELERRLRPILRRCAHRLVTAYTVGKNHPPDIASNHVYAILGFDAERNIVTVRNPWGQHFEPKNEPPGLTNGFPTKEGIFRVPLRDFVRIYSGVTYETGERLR